MFILNFFYEPFFHMQKLEMDLMNPSGLELGHRVLTMDTVFDLTII